MDLEKESVFGIGTDIIEVDRVKSAINSNTRFLKKVFTRIEIEYCENKKTPYTKYISYAQRFAAKESIFKSLGIGLYEQGLFFKDIGITNEENGKPLVTVSGPLENICSEKKISRIEVSMSGLEKYAVAFAIAFSK